jgi:excisionase family DNA binding protein
MADNNQTLSINNLPDLLTVREVATVLRVSPLTIKRWGKRGKLPAIRINSRGDRRYKKEAVLWLLGIQEKKRGYLRHPLIYHPLRYKPLLPVLHQLSTFAGQSLL